MKRYSAFTSAKVSLVAMMTLYGVACSVDGADVNADPAGTRLGEARQGAGGDPGTHNHLRAYCFWDHAFQQTARDLAENKIADSEQKLPSMPYLTYLRDESCRREVMEVLIGCALDEGMKVFDPEDGDHQYDGELGLGVGWAAGGLDKSGQVAVTGCMLQRLNAYGMTMSILLHSDAFPLTTEGEALYPVTESQAWGNMFASTVVLNPTNDPSVATHPAFDGYVCRDAGLFDCQVAGSYYSYGRICDSGSNDCGLISMGGCDNQCPHIEQELCDLWEKRMFSRTPDDSFCDPIPQ